MQQSFPSILAEVVKFKFSLVVFLLELPFLTIPLYFRFLIYNAIPSWLNFRLLAERGTGLLTDKSTGGSALGHHR